MTCAQFAKDRACAMETRLKKLEIELSEVNAAKRAAEREAVAAKAQLAALNRSASTRSSELERLKAQHREELGKKTEEFIRLERDYQKQVDDVESACDIVKKDAMRRLESMSMLERRYRDQTCALERLAQESSQTLDKATKLQSANDALAAQVDRQRKESDSLRNRLGHVEREYKQLQARCVDSEERLEAALHREQQLKEAAASEGESARLAVQEAMRDAGYVTVQRASLAQQVKTLRTENSQLQDTLVDERADKERLREKAQRKLTAAGHEVTALKEHVEALKKDVSSAQAALTALKSDAEIRGVEHQAQIASLQQQVATARKTLDAEKRRVSSTADQLEREWQERATRDVQEAVSKYEKRIQDLELQLTHYAGPYVAAINKSGTTITSIGNGFAGSHGIPGTFTTTLLDYIPRTEHMRLLEARTAAKEAESDAKIATTTAQLERQWRSKIDLVHAELSSTKNRILRLEAELEVARTACVSATKERDSAQRGAAEESAALRSLCDSLREKVQLAETDCIRWHEECTALETALHSLRSQNDQLQNQVEAGRATSDQQSEKIQGLEKTVLTLTATNTELDASLKESQRLEKGASEQLYRLKDRCAFMETTNAALTTSKEELQHGIAQLQVQYNQIVQQHTDLKIQATDAATRVKELEQRNQELCRHSREVERIKEELDQTNQMLASGVSTREKTLSHSAKQIQELDDQKKELQQRVDGLQSEVYRLQAAVRSLTTEAEVAARGSQNDLQNALRMAQNDAEDAIACIITAVESCVREKHQLVPSASSLKPASVSLRDTLLKTLNTSTTKPSNTTSSVVTASALARLESVLDKIRELIDDVATKTTAVQRSQHEATLLASACEEAQSAATTTRQQLTRLEKVYANLENAHAVLSTQHTQLQQQYDALEKQYSSDLSALESTARRQLQTVHTRAEGTIDTLRRTSLHLQQRLTGQTSRADTLAAELDAMQGRMEKQVKQAEEVEVRERELAELMRQVSVNLGISKAAAARNDDVDDDIGSAYAAKIKAFADKMEPSAVNVVADTIPALHHL